jgi:hypothetical protein
MDDALEPLIAERSRSRAWPLIENPQARGQIGSAAMTYDYAVLS